MGSRRLEQTEELVGDVKSNVRRQILTWNLYPNPFPFTLVCLPLVITTKEMGFSSSFRFYKGFMSSHVHTEVTVFFVKKKTLP